MSLRKLPEAQVFARPQNYQWDTPSDVLVKWAETPLAAANGADGDGADTTISMLDVIGEDSWAGGGVTAKHISAALRSIGNRDVTVRINFPRWRCRHRPRRSRPGCALPYAATLMARIIANAFDRVSLEKHEEVSDGYGGVIGQWVVQFERDACILLSKGGETVIASRLQSIQLALIIVRFDVETATITAAWRLIETRSGTVYNIRTSADMERRGRW